MAECEHVSNCAFFQDRLVKMPSMSSMIKQRYCSGPEASNERCARRIVAQKIGRPNVPEDLYPAEVFRVRGIVAEFENR